MHVEEVDVTEATKFISEHVDYATCVQCCKFYIAPETATCGHTLCHLCWKGQRTCPVCSQILDRRALTLNMQMKIITEHIRDLIEHFEKIFGIKVEEFGLEKADAKGTDDHSKNVAEWLASSQNHFSAPPFSESQQSTQNILPPVQITTNTVQVHTGTHKNVSPPKIVHMPAPQDDWDVIEKVPEEETTVDKNKENIVGPMDLEPFYIDDDEYKPGNPRRSSRKKDVSDVKSSTSKKKHVAVDKQSSNNSSMDTDSKTDRAKQNWRNVKKMRKEFSKFNKINRSKLNVSIEKCKKGKGTLTKQKALNSQEKSSENAYTIEKDTPSTIEDNIPKKGMETIYKKVLKNVQTDDNQDLSHQIQKGVAEVDKNDSGICDGDKNKQLHHKSQMDVDIPNENIPKTCEDSVSHSNKKIPFTKKSNFNNEPPISNQVTVNNSNVLEEAKTDDDNIHITIKIGSVVTEITINKKENDVKLKVNSDREVQASLGDNNLTNTVKNQAVVNVQPKARDVQTCTDFIAPLASQPSVSNKIKSLSTKKHTESADTGTAQYEITESVEKELSNIMECEETEMVVKSKTGSQSGKTPKVIADSQKTNPNDLMNADCLDDLDIFNSGSVKEQNVVSLKNAKAAPSEILVPTIRSNRLRSQKNADKRLREDNEDIPTPGKRQKVEESQNKSQSLLVDKVNVLDESESNYDAVMDQVFANIDADIVEIKSQKTQRNKDIQSQHQSGASQQKPTVVEPQQDLKYSENMFSTIGNLDNAPTAGPDTQQHIDNLLTPRMRRALAQPDDEGGDDSDTSVVEDTPQKSNSRSSNRNSANKTVLSAKKLQLKPKTDEETAAAIAKAKSLDSQDIQSIINLTDTVKESQNRDTIVAEKKHKMTLETPLTINRFVDHIKHNSTPVARKSLNFTQNEQFDEDDVTLGPSIQQGKTTQEKQILSEVFANPTTPVRKPLTSKNTVVDDKKICIAGSCLSNTEITNVKILCIKKKWKYVDTFTTDLTHLVVGVDEENKAQRSVKYMCTLASGKWIVSYKWVEKCLQTNTHVNEEQFEALDSTGAAGPRLSRSSSHKLFSGITFYCQPPFSVLDVDTLKRMVEWSGGVVVGSLSEIRATRSAVSLLLAEPANTQEDRFMYMAVDQRIVPMNFEWVLNCLGGYSLCPLHDLLLCPMALLPEETRDWPQELMAVED